METLDKSLALSNGDRVDADLMDLLDFSITGIPAQQFLSGFNTRIARIQNATHIPSKLQGILLLRQAGIIGEQRGRVLACTGAPIEIQDISSVIKKIHLHKYEGNPGPNVFINLTDTKSNSLFTKKSYQSHEKVQ